MSNELKLLDSEDVPRKYEKFVLNNIIVETSKKLNKIKYSDSRYETSKMLRFYTEKNFSLKNVEKELKNVHKKIKRNKKYKISLKDVVLLESLESDGVEIPKDIKYQQLAEKNLPPIELLNFQKLF